MARRLRRNHSAAFKAKVALAAIGRYLAFYNPRRPHSALDGQTPDQAYFIQSPLAQAA